MTMTTTALITDDVKNRLAKIRALLDLQVSLTKKEAALLICLIDTVLRWDYDI